MKRVMLAVALMLMLGPAMAADSGWSDEADAALLEAVTARQIAYCGMRDDHWARGVYVSAMVVTNGAIFDMVKQGDWSAEQEKITLTRLVWAMTEPPPPSMTAADCDDYRNNKQQLQDMDALSASGEVPGERSPY
jgi:hypothetical protein